jgi:hypothetical protein
MGLFDTAEAVRQLKSIITSLIGGSQKTQIVGTTGVTAEVNSDGQLHCVLEGKIDTNNSTVTPLSAAGVFTGSGTSILPYAGIGILVGSDKAGTLSVEYSPDNSDWKPGEQYDIIAGANKFFTPPCQSAYYRLIYTNGAADQGTFYIFPELKKQPFKWSSHNIDMPIVDQDDAVLVKALNTGKSDVTGAFENVLTYKGAMQVDAALVHEIPVNHHFWRESGASTTLTVAVTAGDTSFTVADSTGIVTGNELILRNATHQEDHHLDVVNVAANVITVNRPIDVNYEIGDAVIEIEYNMAATIGSLASPISYKIKPLANERFQITRILLSMLDQTAMDDAKFGGISALTNGVAVRVFTDSAFRTYTHWQSNSDLKDDMYDVEYSDKAPAGFYGLAGRWTFTKGEFVADLDGANGDYLEILIQDDLTDLDDFNIKAQGRLFGG